MTSRSNMFRFQPTFRRKLRRAIEDVCAAEDPHNAAEMSEAFIRLIEHGMASIGLPDAQAGAAAIKRDS